MKRITAWILGIIAVIIALFLLTKLLEPKFMHGIVEGALINEYYDETMDHDVIFIGDCEVYENFSPITLWEDYGITSYIRGSAQQLIWQSYFLLRDTLKYEKPKVVVFNVLALKYNEPQKEEYNRMSIDGMRWSKDKLDCIKASMTEDEQLIEYIFPLLRYHARWSSLEEDDLTYMFKRDKVSHNGYYLRTDVKAAGTFPEGKKLGNYQFGDNAYYYLDQITELCKENDIELILIKAPSLYPTWYDEWDQQMVDYARENDVKYINFMELADEVGLDYSEDTYDGGLHLNVYGAEKLAKYFGKILKTEYNLSGHKGETDYEKVYEEKVDFYNNYKRDDYAQRVLGEN